MIYMRRRPYHDIEHHKQVQYQTRPQSHLFQPRSRPQHAESHKQPRLPLSNRQHHHLSPSQHNTMPLALSVPEPANLHVCSSKHSSAVRPYPRFLVRFLQLHWRCGHLEAHKLTRNQCIRVCCDCRNTNHPAHCPTRCPVDGHYKCGGCYVYPRPRPQPQPQPRPRR
jgi:hypothetical protein